MVHPGVRHAPVLVECLGNELLLAPVDIPIVLLSLTPVPPLQGVQNAVVEVRLKAYLGAVLDSPYKCTA